MAIYAAPFVRFRLAVGFVSADGTPLGDAFLRDFTTRFVNELVASQNRGGIRLLAGLNPVVTLYRSGHAPNVAYWLHADVMFDMRGASDYVSLTTAGVRSAFADALAATQRAARVRGSYTRTTALDFSAHTLVTAVAGPSEASVEALADPAPHDAAAWVLAASESPNAPGPPATPTAPQPVAPVRAPSIALRPSSTVGAPMTDPVLARYAPTPPPEERSNVLAYVGAAGALAVAVVAAVLIFSGGSKPKGNDRRRSRPRRVKGR